LRAACLAGFLMTALYAALSLFPIIDVLHPTAYAAKVGGLSLLCQLIAVAMYRWRRRPIGLPEHVLSAEASSRPPRTAETEG
jgi:hypothetical protein